MTLALAEVAKNIKSAAEQTSDNLLLLDSNQILIFNYKKQTKATKTLVCFFLLQRLLVLN